MGRRLSISRTRGLRGLGGGGGAAAAAWTPLDFGAALKQWLRDQAVADGSGNANPWTDLSASGWDASNGTATSRPLITTDARLGGQFALHFDGTADALNPLPSAASDWTRAHDGSDICMWGAWAADTAATGNRVFASTFSAISALNHGFALRMDTTNSDVDLFVGNGTGTFVVNATGSSVAKNVGHYWAYRANSTGYELRIDGAPYLSAAWTGTPSSSAPTVRMWQSGLNGANSFWDGTIAEFGRADTYPASLADLESYLAARYGL